MKPVRARSAKLLEEIAKEEGISTKKVDIILQSVFGKIAEDIRTQSCIETKVLYLGKFRVKPFKLRQFLEQKEHGNNIESKG